MGATANSQFDKRMSSERGLVPNSNRNESESSQTIQFYCLSILCQSLDVFL